MKQSVVKELSTPELRERLEEEKKQLTKLKFNHAVSPLENPMKIQVYKKTVARLETELRLPGQACRDPPNAGERANRPSRPLVGAGLDGRRLECGRKP